MDLRAMTDADLHAMTDADRHAMTDADLLVTLVAVLLVMIDVDLLVMTGADLLVMTVADLHAMIDADRHAMTDVDLLVTLAMTGADLHAMIDADRHVMTDVDLLVTLAMTGADLLAMTGADLLAMTGADRHVMTGADLLKADQDLKALEDAHLTTNDSPLPVKTQQTEAHADARAAEDSVEDLVPAPAADRSAVAAVGLVVGKVDQPDATRETKAEAKSTHRIGSSSKKILMKRNQLSGRCVADVLGHRTILGRRTRLSFFLE